MSTPSALATIGASAIFAGLQLVTSNPSYSQQASKPMSQRELKELLSFSTTKTAYRGSMTDLSSPTYAELAMPLV